MTGCVVLYSVQEDLIFHPTVLPDNYRFRAGEEVFFKTEDNVDLHGLWLRRPESKGVILYWHGNKGSADRALYQTRYLQGHGYDIFIPEYRGFCKSAGVLTHENDIYQDARAAYIFLQKHYREDQIVVFGYSLGTGPSTYLAREFNPQQVFLVTPFTSIADRKDEVIPFIPDAILKYELNNAAHVRESDEEMHIFHGTNDEVIPYAHGKKLAAIRSGISFYTLNGVSHRQAIFDPTLARVLAAELR